VARDLLVQILGVFFLDMAAVGQHDPAEIERCGRAVDRAGVSLPDETGKVAAVIDVGM